MNIKNKNLSNGIVTVTIDEPKTYNSLSFKNLTDLLKTLQKLDKDKKVKVIILEGAGKGFSAGHNLKSCLFQILLTFAMEEELVIKLKR